MCEEFGCTPAEALRQDWRLVRDIMDLRAYARAKVAVDRARNDADVEGIPMVDAVWAVQADLLKERRGQD